MKKLFLIAMMLVLSVSVIAQQKIQLRSANKAECVKSDMRNLKASFSFATIEAKDFQSERGTFSVLSLPNTVIGGNEGDPQIPVVNELIAVPFGANPRIEITSYSTTDYRLEDYGIHTLVPRQPDIFKNQDPQDVPFVYNEAAYQTRGLRSEPTARVSVNGTMRGVQIGQLSIEPVSYDPVNNTLRVFNDIEVTVSFDGANVRATEDILVKTYSPYFDVLYKQLFNSRAVRDVYDEHPDLWQAPVKMLVIANRMFESCIQDWVAWKTLKGIYVDVNYTDDIGTSADAIKSFIQNKYAQDAPTFLIIMGDKDQVAPSVTSASNTSRVSDLYYSSVDGDEFVDMFHSRFSATTTAEMTAILNKGMEYEQYTMPDPSYLNNVLLIAGEDDGWGVTVGRPTIWYATNYYYNAEHGFNNVYEFSHGTYTNCYAPLSSGVGFANYTAHGSQTSWAGPSFSVSDVNNLTNEHKYFLAMGNCCQSGDWGYGTCFGEALTRAENKGAYAYIGSCPNTTWKNDYYFGVGPTNRADGTMPSYEETGMGCYDAIWMDDVYNTVNSILYVGLLAGNAAGALGYELHSQTLYYWQAYHVLGDGSIMPYRVQPTANQVSHMAILPIGMQTYEVSAVPGSYVAISKDGVLHGTALVGETGTVQVPITPVTSGGDVTICVTAPNRIPYIQTVPAAALEGAYIAMDSYTPTEAHVGDNTSLSITFKNVGTDASTGTTNITLTSTDPNVTLINYTGSFGALAPEATTTVSGFSFSINPGVADGTNVTIHYTAVNGSDTYEGNIVIKANEAVLAYQNMSWNGGFTPGETLTLTAKFKNTGHYQATNAVVTMTTTSSNYLTISTPTVNVGTIAVDQEITCQFTVTIAANCPETAQIPVTFTMTANGGLTEQGNETLKNACNVYFVLVDSRNDGWDGNATLKVSFDDGTPEENLTISSGESPKTFALEIGNGTHVTLTWVKGTYDNECSFTVSYEGDLVLYEMAANSNPSAGVLFEFDCNCAAASQTFMVNVSSLNTGQGTVSGGGEYSFGQSCTVTATPAEGYMFTYWTMNGEIISSANPYTFIVSSDMDLVANFAEGNQIGSGDGTSNYLPSYNYYNYTLSQQIYTAQELGAAGTIINIAFYNAGAEKTRTYDFYIKATTKDSFTSATDWVTVSDSDKVYSGSVTMVANDWTWITFDTPFEYDGISNLILVTDDNSGAWTSSPHMNCRVFEATNQALYVYSDGTDYDPLSPPTSSSSNNAVLSVKNQIRFTKESNTPAIYNVNVTASPTDGGNVTGAGEYDYGTLATLTATANEGYTFVNWTIDGVEVSTESTYSFTVTGDANLVANFTLISYIVTAVPSSFEGGTITIGGNRNRDEFFYDFEDGTSQGWTALQGTNGDSPNSWMHSANYDEEYSTGYGHNASNGFMVSESYLVDGTGPVHPDNYLVSPRILLGGSISFWATNVEDGYAEHFAVAVSMEGNTDAADFTTVQEWTFAAKAVRTGGTRSLDNGTWYEYTADLSAFSGKGYVAIHHFDCYDQWLLCVDDITLVEGDLTSSATFNHGETCTVTATANEGYAFVNWTEDGEEVSTESAYSFVVTADRNLVANFEEHAAVEAQTMTLTQGVNWWSTNLDITLDQLKDAIAAALGTTGTATIKSQGNAINYINGRWRPANMPFDIREMYRIEVSSDCEITLTGTLVNPADYEITISYGVNWIGFLPNESMTLDAAFSGLNPVAGDVVKSKNGSSSYTGTIWRGSLGTVEPGHGYIYESKASGNKTFTY